MGVVSVSSSASRVYAGLSRSSTVHQSSIKGPLILGIKVDKNKKTALVAVSEPSRLRLKTKKENNKRVRSVTKPSKGVRVFSVAEASPYAVELDLNEAAAKLESIFKLSPSTDALDAENIDQLVKEKRRKRKKSSADDQKKEEKTADVVVRNKNRKPKRLNLAKRIEMKQSKESKEEKDAPLAEKNRTFKNEDEKIDEVVREYSASTDLVSLDWKKMKIPPVLPSSEHTWLFKLMEPMKALNQVKENLRTELGREPTDNELGDATNMTVVQVRRHLEVGHAARNKLIKIRVEIQKAKLELMFELKRMPTEEEILKRVGISAERYQDVMQASNAVSSLHSRNQITQEELINGIVDVDGVGSNDQRQPALRRLALDDVLDSLKPKEGLVIRQRYGLDGKGDRTLGEIAGNLNISREMVRKHEMKALMKLKHPA